MKFSQTIFKKLIQSLTRKHHVPITKTNLSVCCEWKCQCLCRKYYGSIKNNPWV